jgi:hypothetical protein
MITPQRQRINELETLTARLAWNHRFGCYTRQGFEFVKWPEVKASARWVIYFDIDKLHDLNNELGKKEVDRRIHQALGTLRTTDYVFAGQYASGDEFLVIVCEEPGRPTEDPKGLIERLAGEFKKVGIKATYGFDAVKGTDLEENVDPVADLVHEHKKARGASRGEG